MSKKNNAKRSVQLQLEECYNSALLLSLRGIDCVLLNNYSVSSDVNNASFETIWNSLYEGSTMASALRAYRELETYSIPTRIRPEFGKI